MTYPNGARQSGVFKNGEYFVTPKQDSPEESPAGKTEK
jgi:hypothetical protein